MQFTVAPVHAAIIMRFQEKSRYLKNCIIVCIIRTLLTKSIKLSSWTSKTLATEIGIPVDSLNRRISFWTSKVWHTHISE
jgi:anaphase-promoting complex subunit 2